MGDTNDTRKIIERYKRELMEMSKASGSSKPAAQSSLNSSESGAESPVEKMSAEKKPQVIGYVSGDKKDYDNFLEELSKMPAPEKESESHKEAPGISETDISDSCCAADTCDVIIEESAVEEVVLDEKAVNEEAPEEAAPEPREAVLGLNEQGRTVSPDIEAPLFIKSPNNSDNESAEIIDEVGTEDEPLFSSPNYIFIPSTEKVRSEITNGTEDNGQENDRPEDKVSGVTNNSTNAPRPEQPSKVSVTTEEQAERLGKQPVSGKDPDEKLTGRSFEPEDSYKESISRDSQNENSDISRNENSGILRKQSHSAEQSGAEGDWLDETAAGGFSDSQNANLNMWRGSRGQPTNFPRTEFKDYEDFQKQNPGRGTIVFRVYTGRQALPLANAECVIYTRINGEKHELARMLTNSSGQTPLQSLPAPNKALSQQSENKIQAFALYDAKVTKQGFSQVILEDIPVFDGVMSVQKVFMIVAG